MTSYNKADLANGLIGAAVTTSATSITLQSGYGAAMPAVPFKATLSPFGQLPSLGNSEIILVTAISGDTLTVTRAQNGTTAKAFANGDIIGNGIYTTDVPIISGTGANVLKDDGTYGLVGSSNVDSETFLALYSTTGTLNTIIPNAYTTYNTITGVTRGKRVEITAMVSISDGISGNQRTGHIRVQCDGVSLDDVVWQTYTSGGHVLCSYLTSHTPAAGNHTWTLQVEADTASASAIRMSNITVKEMI